jgi:hypothetical protein
VPRRLDLLDLAVMEGKYGQGPLLGGAKVQWGAGRLTIRSRREQTEAPTCPKWRFNQPKSGSFSGWDLLIGLGRMVKAARESRNAGPECLNFACH